MPHGHGLLRAGALVLTLQLGCGSSGDAVASAAGSGGVSGAAHGGSGGSAAGASGRAGTGVAGTPSDRAGAGGAAAGHMAGAGAGGVTAAGSGGQGGQPASVQSNTMLVGVGAWGLRGTSAGGREWRYCGSPSTGDDHTPNLLRNVGFGDGVFIAVGGDASNSMVMRTQDGVRWQEDLHATSACAGEAYPASCKNWMGAVAYADGVWLAGGGNGALMRSFDAGLTWLGLHGFVERHIRSMGVGAEHFVAGTDGGGLYVSGDEGETWTEHVLWRDAASSAYLSFAHDARTVIAFGGSAGSCFVSRDDAVSWSPCAAAVATSTSFAHDATQWVAVVSGGYATSPDAETWTEHTLAGLPRELRFVAGTWYGRNEGSFYVGASLEQLTRVLGDGPDYRAWAAGEIEPENAALTGSACVDAR